MLNDYLDWPGVAQVIQRTCQRLIATTGEIQEETNYGITSLTYEQARPEHLEQVWRGHWTIENRTHYVRDETMGEDRCQVHTGNAPQALAALRNGVITALRYKGWCNIAEAMRHFGASVQRALILVGAITT
jgi:predicted transposase YbfD/YdcC